MTKDCCIDKIKEYIKENYDSECTDRTWWDTGNHDDSYQIGMNEGEARTLYAIGKLIGMELEPPKEIDFDEVM